MSTKLEERQKQRQDEIITAARRCFRASGFHAASMSQIASEAKLSVGQIYRYFSNKDAIIEEMIRRIIDYYSRLRPHQYNGGLTPNESERLYWEKLKTVASFT